MVGDASGSYSVTLADGMVFKTFSWYVSMQDSFYSSAKQLKVVEACMVALAENMNSSKIL